MADEQPKPLRKIVLTFGDNQVSIGLDAAECDPIFSFMPLNQAEEATTPLDQVLEHLPAAIHEARQHWDAQAQNPTYQRPALPVWPATPTPAAGSGRWTPARPSGPTQQPLI